MKTAEGREIWRER